MDRPNLADYLEVYRRPAQHSPDRHLDRRFPRMACRGVREGGCLEAEFPSTHEALGSVSAEVRWKEQATATPGDCSAAGDNRTYT